MMSNKPPAEHSERLFIQGYQVFCNESGQPNSASRPSGDVLPEKDPDDLPVTFEVKTEPVDPEYETSATASPASIPSPVPTPMPIVGTSSPRPRPQLKDVLPRLKQIQQMNSSAPANVIDELVKNNEFLLAKNDAEGYKPNSRKVRNPGEAKRPENLMESSLQTFLVSPSSQARISEVKSEPGQKIKDDRFGKILRPRSPTRKCTIPEKDKTHFNYALMESSVKDQSSEKIFRVQKHEMVCAVTCKAMYMTQGGAFKGDFDLQFYWCNFCTFHTTNKAQLIQHGMEHRFHCKFCRYQSFSRADIIHHTAKVHADDFREAANSLKYCILLSDYLQIYSQDTDEDRKKRAAPDDDDNENDERPPEKAARLEGRSVDSLSPDELKKLQNDYQIFDMDVETVDETDKNIVTEEPASVPLVTAPTSVDVPSDKQIMGTYEAPKTNHVAIAESSFQPNILQNIPSVKTVPVSRAAPIPVSLVAANSRPVIISRLAAPSVPVGQLLVQNIANTSVRSTPVTNIIQRIPSLASSPLTTHRALENRPPPPPPSSKTKPGPGSTVSSSLYWSCGYCSFTSHSQSEIKEHSQKLHRGKPHRYVALIMPSDKQSQNSQNSEGAKGTNDGNITSKDIEIDNAEESSDSVPVESDSESFKCFHCSFLVKKPELIKEHLFSKHPSLSMVGVDIHSTRLKNIFYCPRDDCPFRSKNPSLFQAHVERCTPWQMKDLNIAVEKHLLDCLENTIKFSKAVQLKEQVSTNLSELSCIYCSFNSSFPSRVKHHMILKHPHESMVIRPKTSLNKELAPLIYFCTLCQWHTRIKHRRKIHMLMVHHIENDDIREGNVQVYHEDQFRKQKYAALHQKDSSEVEWPVEPEDHVRSADENENSDNKSEENENDDISVVENTERQSLNDANILSSVEDVDEHLSEQVSNHFYIDNTNHTVYRCLFCFGECTGIFAMKSHLQNVHPSQKMQVVNVEKCNNQVKCIFFVCPEEHCTILFTKESLLIKHAQSHESMCVSLPASNCNQKTETIASKKCQTSDDTVVQQMPGLICTTHTTVQDSVIYSQPAVSRPIDFSGQSVNSSPKTARVLALGAPSQVVSHTVSLPLMASDHSGSTQNTTPVFLERLNQSFLSPVAPSEVVSNLNSLPSALPPCPGGLRIAICLSTPHLYPQLGPTVMTNSPLPSAIPPSNASFPLIRPSRIITSTAPSQQTTPVTLQSGKVAIPRLVLRMMPPTSKVSVTGVVSTSTSYVAPLQIPKTETTCIDTHLRPSPLLLPASLKMNKVYEDLEDPSFQKVCLSDHQINDNKPKQESVEKEDKLAAKPDKELSVSLIRRLLTEPSGDKDTNKSVGSIHGRKNVSGFCEKQNQDKTKNITLDSTETAWCKTDIDVDKSKPVITSYQTIPESDSVAKSTDQVNPKHKNSSKAKTKSKKKISKEAEVTLTNVKYIKNEIIDSASVCDNTEKTGCGNEDSLGSLRSKRRTARNIKKQTQQSDVKTPFKYFTCKFCEFSVEEGVMLIKSHIVENHPEEKLETYYMKNHSSKPKIYYLCPAEACIFCFPRESLLVEHWMSTHENQEEIAEQKAEETSESVGKKKSSPQSKIKMAYECLYCLVSHMEPDLTCMKKHYEDKHQGQEMIMRDLKVGTLKNSRVVVCSHPGCCYQSDNPKELTFQYHQLAHSSSKMYRCSLCEWFSPDSCAGTEHLLLSHAKDPTPGVLLELSLELQHDGTKLNIQEAEIESEVVRGKGYECAARGCKNKQYNEDGEFRDGTHFFRFPPDEEGRRKWCQLINRPLGEGGFKVTNGTRLCHHHFAEKHLRKMLSGYWELKPNAEPTLNLS